VETLHGTMCLDAESTRVPVAEQGCATLFTVAVVYCLCTCSLLACVYVPRGSAHLQYAGTGGLIYNRARQQADMLVLDRETIFIQLVNQIAQIFQHLHWMSLGRVLLTCEVYLSYQHHSYLELLNQSLMAKPLLPSFFLTFLCIAGFLLVDF
jgi:hypothetical protein